MGLPGVTVTDNGQQGYKVSKAVTDGFQLKNGADQFHIQLLPHDEMDVCYWSVTSIFDLAVSFQLLLNTDEEEGETGIKGCKEGSRPPLSRTSRFRRWLGDIPMSPTPWCQSIPLRIA